MLYTLFTGVLLVVAAVNLGAVLWLAGVCVLEWWRGE